AVESLSEMIYGSPEEKRRLTQNPGTDNLNDPAHFLESIVKNVLAQYRSYRITKEERLEVIQFLNTKGAFRIKGAVALVAERLGVSTPTIYRYIEEVSTRTLPIASRY